MRRTVPLAIRVHVAVARRWLRDRRARVVFARTRLTTPAGFPFLLAEYRRDFIDYPGQEHLGAAKRRNQAILAQRLDGVVIGPGETFAVWTLAPRPSRREGYAAAAAPKAGELVQEIGGSICLLSTALYNAALLGGLEIVEHWCHSIDSYGNARYFELGRDAAVEFGYRDLRFRNPYDQPVLVRITVDPVCVSAAIHSLQPAWFAVALQVDPVERPVGLPAGAFAVSTERVTTSHDGRTIRDDLGVSVYRAARP